MKRFWIILFAILLFGVCPALAEETVQETPGEAIDETIFETPAGTWYGELEGFILTLSLQEDGTYALSVPGGEEVADGPDAPGEEDPSGELTEGSADGADGQESEGQESSAEMFSGELTYSAQDYAVAAEVPVSAAVPAGAILRVHISTKRTAGIICCWPRAVRSMGIM